MPAQWQPDLLTYGINPCLISPHFTQFEHYLDTSEHNLNSICLNAYFLGNFSRLILATFGAQLATMAQAMRLLLFIGGQNTLN
jgi:hypothetical protein